MKSFYDCFTTQDENKEFSNKFALKDSNSGYNLKLDKSQEVSLNMTYKNDLLKIDANKVSNVKFAPNGYIKFVGNDTDYSLEIISNDGYHFLPWYDVTVKGINSCVGNINKTDEGIIIHGDNLLNVEVSAQNDDVLTKATFSTAYSDALIYSIDDYTIGIKVDTNADDIFDKTIAQSKTSLNIDEYSISGDINNDNLISSVDLLLLKKYILLGIGKISTQSADINKDDSINLFDILELKKYLLS